MKPLRFIGSSLDDLKDFPSEARREAGFELHAVQAGLMPSDFKPMLDVGPGAYEIRVRVMGEWRVSMSPGSMMPCMSCMPSRRRHRKHARKTSNWRPGATGRSEVDMAQKNERVSESSGNVFTDLGFENEEAVLLKLRADLMAGLRVTIAERGWTQQQAADHLHIGQSRVSDLVRGKWQKFSLDMLVTLATRAGRRVDLTMA